MITVSLLSHCISFSLDSVLTIYIPCIHYYLCIDLSFHISFNKKVIFYLTGFLHSIAIMTVCLNILFLPAATWAYRSLPLRVLINDDSKRELLAWRSPVRLAVNLINEINVSRTPVAFLTVETYGAGLNADLLASTWHNKIFNNSIRAIKSTDDLAAVLIRYDSTYIILDENWGDPVIRKIVKDGSSEIMDFRHITVRRLN